MSFWRYTRRYILFKISPKTSNDALADFYSIPVPAPLPRIKPTQAVAQS